MINITCKTYRGTINFNDIMKAGTTKDRTEIQNLQNRLQFDEPINIQFTSVSLPVSQITNQYPFYMIRRTP